MLSNRKFAIQWININKTYCTIHQIEIYQVDSVIHYLNNWGQNLNCHGAMSHHWGHMLSEISFNLLFWTNNSQLSLFIYM